MGRHDIWRVTIHWWLHAIRRGQKPFATYELLNDQGGYNPRQFFFRHVPSKHDFLEMCRHIPWTEAWDAVTSIQLHDWPAVAIVCKAAHMDLRNADGKKIGLIEIDRIEVYENQEAPRPEKLPRRD